MLTSSLPKYSGEISAEGLSNQVEIYRDSMAIPYIIAGNEEGAAFALGYVHAQERLFTMDIIRRAGEGRLSEIFGHETVPFDKMFLTVGIKRIVQQNLKKIDPEEMKILEAYSRGINLYIKEAEGKYPVEFDILGYDPYEWKPEHTLIIGRMLAWELNISWWVDISFTHLVQKLGEEKVLEILPGYPENGPYIIPPELKSYPKITTDLIETDKAFRKFMGMDGTHLGSNNWIVNGSFSKSGKPIIANDTHLHFSAPGKWFAAVIRGGSWNVEGFTLPGVPAVLIGKNENISWAVTNIMLDDADFYIEKIDSSGKKYLFNQKWETIESYKEVIKVKDSTDVTLIIQSTHHGPIISDIHPFNFVYPDKNIPKASVSMQWLGSEFSDEIFSFIKINKAKNWNEFKSAFKTFSLPGQNFVFGDKAGNIGYLFGGRLPKRENVSPTFIYDGTTDKYDWKGFIQPVEMPSLFNPPENFIASANNKTIKDFKYHISNVWEPHSRYERIVELLSSKQKHSVEDYKKYQNDFISLYSKGITKHILGEFEKVEVKDKNLSY